MSELLWHYRNDLHMFDIYERVEGEAYQIRQLDRVKPGPTTDPTRHLMARIHDLEASLL